MPEKENEKMVARLQELAESLKDTGDETYKLEMKKIETLGPKVMRIAILQKIKYDFLIKEGVAPEHVVELCKDLTGGEDFLDD